jgi:hypothetical protein
MREWFLVHVCVLVCVLIMILWQVVLRINNPVVAGWQQHVGSKTTHR